MCIWDKNNASYTISMIFAYITSYFSFLDASSL